MKKIGLALGGGGAKGLAHISMLEVFDELGIKPCRIAGTSIGAVIGALYASGLSGRYLREHVQQMIISKGETFREALKKKEALKLIKLVDPEFGGHGLFKGEKFMEFLYEAMGVSTFEKLKIPLSVVATDFWKSEQVVFESGKLLPALKASMGLPGVFTPVTMDDRVLIDGGGVNPVPHDLLDDCDIVVAVDVLGPPCKKKQEVPNLFLAMNGMFEIMQNSIVEARLKNDPPDIYIKPNITCVELLEFYKAEKVFLQAEPAQKELRKKLEHLL